MKKLLGLLFCLALFLKCDDGDLITENFVFDNATLQKCTNSSVLYKINGSEALILNTPESSFPNTVGEKSIPISGSTSITYRKYVSVVSANTICETPVIPVLEQWSVSGGTVSITTKAVFDNSGVVIVRYNHTIVFKNVTFVTNGKQVVYDAYSFGNFQTDITNLNFDFSADTTQKCSGNNLIFKFNGSKALLLDIDPTLFVNNITAGIPRVRAIGTNNKVIYRVYNGTLNTNFFCGAIVPNNPILTEEWTANDGVLGTSGEIRVETIMVGAQYKHTISLYKTTFTKNVLTYTFPTSDLFVFGDYLTN